MKTIIIVKRADEYIAYIEERGEESWGCGDTIDEAVGDLVRAHRGFFNIAIEREPSQDEKRNQKINH